MTNTQTSHWWHELNTWEPKAALAFYSQTLGWDFEPSVLPDGSCYWVGRKEGKALGGIFQLTAPEFEGTPAHWMTYLSVNDINKAQDIAIELGGEVLREPVRLVGVGRLALVSDAAGALIGLFEPEGARSLAGVH